jgi:hypothetical protein
MSDERLIYDKIMDETKQAHSTRIELYKKLEVKLKRPVVSFYHNFYSPAELSDADVTFLEEILRNSDLKNGAALIINSPGGDPIAAERMIKNLRIYCGKGGYYAIVPKMAMSAAALVCLGSSKIIMSPTSVLGPVDPQIGEYNPKTKKYEWYSAYNILNGYKKIFNKAEKLNKKLNLEPYLQALEDYKPKQIEEYKSYMALSSDIATNALKTGMLKGKNDAEIQNNIRMFLTPEITKIHQRCIYPQEAKNCGLNIEVIKVNDDFWKNISELHLRMEYYIRLVGAANVIETKDASYVRGLSKEESYGE